MIAQRLGTTALRRVTATPQNAFFTQNLARLALTSSLSTTQTRPVATQKLTTDDARALLDAQRLKRPVSPHLDIYDKKQTYFGGSIWQRFTGAGFVGLLYGYSVAYLAAPLVGWHLESASLVAAFAALPVAAKAALKFTVAFPFIFHVVNGIKHVGYDLALGFRKTTVIKAGWYVWGASVLGALGLLLL